MTDGIVPAPETIEAMLDYARESLDLVAPAVFRKVNPAVVVTRAKGQDIENAGGLARFTETGSGVLLSSDGKIMTAAQVVHSMDEIAVEFLGGETVASRRPRGIGR